MKQEEYIAAIPAEATSASTPAAAAPPAPVIARALKNALFNFRDDLEASFQLWERELKQVQRAVTRLGLDRAALTKDKALLQGLLEATRDINKQLETRAQEQAARIGQYSEEAHKYQKREKEQKANLAAVEQALEKADERCRQLEVDAARRRVERAAEKGPSSRAEVEQLRAECEIKTREIARLNDDLARHQSCTSRRMEEMEHIFRQKIQSLRAGYEHSLNPVDQNLNKVEPNFTEDSVGSAVDNEGTLRSLAAQLELVCSEKAELEKKLKSQSEQAAQEQALQEQQAGEIERQRKEMCALKAELEQEKKHAAVILDAANEMEARMSKLCLHIKVKDEEIMRLRSRVNEES